MPKPPRRAPRPAKPSPRREPQASRTAGRPSPAPNPLQPGESERASKTRRTQPDSHQSSDRLRLNKALAQAGVCSRRAADELIKAGRVAVNGTVVDTPGVTVDPLTDTVTVDKRPIATSAGRAPTVVALHKPTMVVTTASDPQGRQTVLDLLPDHLRAARLFPVGRLDYFSEGLLLLTDDGELAYRLTHPKWHLPKTYRVQVRGDLTPEKVKRMRQGMTLAEGDTTASARVQADPTRPDRQPWLTIELIQGLNRQIRRMCRDLDLTVLRIVRTAQGPIRLGDLPKGAWRELAAEETVALRQAVGMGMEATEKGGIWREPSLP